MVSESVEEEWLQHFEKVSKFDSAVIFEKLARDEAVSLTYLNPEKIFRASPSTYQCFSSLRTDGLFFAGLCKMLFRRDVEQASFDFSSMAGKIFSLASEKRLTIALIGGQKHEVEVFGNLLSDRYNLSTVFISDGFFPESGFDSKATELIESGANLAIIGLGGTKQDRFASHVIDKGYKGSVFCCGAFISQTSRKGEQYYPSMIKRLNLRWLYRFFEDPRVIRRVLVFYPRAIVLFIMLAKRKKAAGSV